MAVAANKRSIMTLFSGADDLYSHQVRIVLAEKGVTVDVLQVDPSDMPEDLIVTWGSLPKSLRMRFFSVYE